MVGADKDITSIMGANLNIPLEFWFCRNVGLALPLIALQYHEVKINIQFEEKANCVIKTVAGSGSETATTELAYATDIKESYLWVDYIFLDTDERRRFAQLSHEYLIEQLQFTGQESLTVGTNRIKLNFNHPCKELIWVAKPGNYNKKACWYNYTDLDAADAVPTNFNTTVMPTNSTFFATSNYITGVNFTNYTGVPDTSGTPFADAILQLNGNDRFSVREATYFTYVQPYQHHTCIPSNPGIHVYSFALKPEEHQPSGTLNMSRIDTATLMLNTKKQDLLLNATGTQDSTGYTKFDGVNIYAVNYNVLRILSGMGGLAYSN